MHTSHPSPVQLQWPTQWLWEILFLINTPSPVPVRSLCNPSTALYAPGSLLPVSNASMHFYCCYLCGLWNDKGVFVHWWSSAGFWCVRVSGHQLAQLSEECIVCWWLRSCWAAGVWHSPSVPPNAPVCTTDAVMALAPGKNTTVLACVT